MNPLCCWLLTGLARSLEVDEREAVLGDFVESGVTGGPALFDLLGLVARRQVKLWQAWRPWVALTGLVGVVGLLLLRIDTGFAGALAIQLRTFLRHGVRYEAGLTLPQDVFVLVCHGVALIFWSWCAGFVLALLAGRTTWIGGTLFHLFWVSFVCSHLALFFRAYPYSVLLLSTLMVTVLIPSAWGVRSGILRGNLGLGASLSLTIACAVFTALATWTGGWSQASMESMSGGTWSGGVVWPARWLQFTLVSWPVGYIAMTALNRRGTA